MNLRMITLVCAATIGAATAFAQPQPASPTIGNELVKWITQTFDEAYVKPEANLASYRKVMLDQPQIVFRKNWLKDINNTRDVSRWLTPADQQKYIDDMSAGMGQTFSEVFRSRGYEVVTAPGPGVLRVTPTGYRPVAQRARRPVEQSYADVQQGNRRRDPGGGRARLGHWCCTRSLRRSPHGARHHRTSAQVHERRREPVLDGVCFEDPGDQHHQGIRGDTRPRPDLFGGGPVTIFFSSSIETGAMAPVSISAVSISAVSISGG